MGPSPAAHAGKPRVLFLDIMSTLVHDPFHNDMHPFLGFGTLKEMLSVKHPTRWIEFEKGQIDEEQFLQDFFKDGRDFDRAGFREHVKSKYEFLPGIEELLHELREAGDVALHACSNYPCWFEYIEERLRLSRFLQWTFVSCRVGVRKPEAAAFEAALRLAGVEDPAHALFVDDSEANVEAARRAGLRALLFEGAPALRRDLVAHGLLPPSRPGPAAP